MKMTNLSKKVNLKEPIDPDKLGIEKLYPDKELYAVDFPLDSTPDHIWEKCFARESKIAVLNLQRRVEIFGDSLRLIAPADEIKEKIEGIRGLVGAVNKCVEEYNEEMKRKEKIENAKKKQEEETKKRIRDSLRGK